MTLRSLVVSCLCLVAMAPGPARPADTLFCFNAGEFGSCEARVLEHVDFKSVVLQFVDPANTGLGEGLARMLWREILESIYDLSGAGVILAYDRTGEIEEALGESDLGSFLQRTYHQAARAIAEQQDAQMAIWGAVLPDGDGLYVQMFITLRETRDNPWTTFSFAVERPVRLHLTASLGRSRLNLPAISGSREALVGGRYVTRCHLDAGCPDGIALRAGASNTAPIVDRAREGDAVEVVDMQQQWLKVAGTRERWINIYHVEVFPRIVTFFSRNNVNLRDAPNGERMASVDLDGSYAVLDAARYGRFDEPWYRLVVDGRRGWIAGRLVNRRSYTFPGVHLIAGLYRYGRGQYDIATAELESFLETVPEEDNVTRAATLKFMAASRAASQGLGPRVEPALQDLDEALRYTPFDPGVHTLRALINAGSNTRVEDAVGDLRRALDIDSTHQDALRILRTMSGAAGPMRLNRLYPGGVDESVEAELESLEEAYIHSN